VFWLKILLQICFNVLRPAQDKLESRAGWIEGKIEPRAGQDSAESRDEKKRRAEHDRVESRYETK
jgi:hypothetical protein